MNISVDIISPFKTQVIITNTTTLRLQILVNLTCYTP